MPGQKTFWMQKMESWAIFAGLAIVAWGFWGFFPKIATRHIDPKSAIVYEVIGAVIVGILALVLVRFRPESHPVGVTFAVLTGVAAMLGGLFYLYAISKGSTPVVVTMTALYPVITIALAFTFLREPITWKQGAGICLAIAAMVLMVI
jgi:transporter family protein